jgi:hypothetical protein
MGRRLSSLEEKKLPFMSVSIEKSLKDRFDLVCSKNNVTMSAQLREMIIKYVKKEEKDEQ